LYAKKDIHLERSMINAVITHSKLFQQQEISLFAEKLQPQQQNAWPNKTLPPARGAAPYPQSGRDSHQSFCRNCVKSDVFIRQERPASQGSEGTRAKKDHTKQGLGILHTL
jgi:hypothetical protein